MPTPIRCIHRAGESWLWHTWHRKIFCTPFLVEISSNWGSQVMKDWRIWFWIQITFRICKKMNSFIYMSIGARKSCLRGTGDEESDDTLYLNVLQVHTYFPRTLVLTGVNFFCVLWFEIHYTIHITRKKCTVINFFFFFFAPKCIFLLSLYSIWVWRRESNPQHSSVYLTLAHWATPVTLLTPFWATTVTLLSYDRYPLRTVINTTTKYKCTFVSFNYLR